MTSGERKVLMVQNPGSSRPLVDPSPSGKTDAGTTRVWLADLTYTQQTVAADVMPNAVGCIAMFTETLIGFAEPIKLFKYPGKLIAALEAEGAPDVIGFSNYIWNFTLSYRIAEAIKRRFPATAVVFGGPNYSTDADEQEAFLRKHPAIDFYIVKEGELAFANLVKALIELDFEVEAVKRRGIPSVHAIAADGRALMAATIDRIRDLTQIPSPYSSGRLDEFFDGVLLPIIQTNRGCPFSCTFCVEGVNYYNKVYRSSSDKVAGELHYIGAKMRKLREQGGRNDLFIADSNFGMFQEDLETCRTLKQTREQFGWPEYINVATGKNKKERVLEASSIIDGALRLSGSVQSLDSEVLRNIKRQNISAGGLLDLALAANKIGANTYSEIILALPGDSKERHLRTVQQVMDAGFTNIYLFQLMLLPGTEMAAPEQRRQFRMVTRYRVLPRCYGHFELFGERIVAAEIEEICVENETLTFQDYVDCRRFHLIVTIFHNDGIFGSLLKLLRALQVPIYRWMELLNEARLPADLQQVFDSFSQATREELWKSRDELEGFIRTPGICERFIAGELGNNLLFVHKTIAITQHIDALASLARETILRCLAESGKAGEEEVQFVEDALTYHALRAKNLFTGQDEEPSAILRYDIAAFERDAQPSEIRDYRLAAPRSYCFVLNDAQRDLIRRYVGIYGSSPVSIGRILSKVYVRKLFREAVPAEAAVHGLPGIKGDIQYHLAGLQS